MILYQSTESTYMPDFGLYAINPIPGRFAQVNIDDLATFHPIQLHIVENSPAQFLASLPNKPILFEK